jgi:hypothetical protein
MKLMNEAAVASAQVLTSSFLPIVDFDGVGATPPRSYVSFRNNSPVAPSETVTVME